MVSKGVDENKDIHPLLTDPSGRLFVIKYGHPNKTWKFVALGTTNETTVWDPTSGKTFVLTDILVSVNNNMAVTFRDGAAGDTIFLHRLLQNTTHGHHFITPIESEAADNILTAQTTDATAYITVVGYEI